MKKTVVTIDPTKIKWKRIAGVLCFDAVLFAVGVVIMRQEEKARREREYNAAVRFFALGNN